MVCRALSQAAQRRAGAGGADRLSRWRHYIATATARIRFKKVNYACNDQLACRKGLAHTRPATLCQTELFGADDRNHHARGRPASRTRTPRAGTQNHFREYEGIRSLCSKGSRPTTSRDGLEASSAGRSSAPTRSASGSTRTKSSGGSRRSSPRTAPIPWIRRKRSRPRRPPRRRPCSSRSAPAPPHGRPPPATRVLGTAADLTVAMVSGVRHAPPPDPGCSGPSC